jgi:hypothetical protein
MYQLLKPLHLRDGAEPEGDVVTAGDSWTGAPWTVYGGSEYLKPAERLGEFTLTAVADPITGATAYYRVGFTSGNMPRCWHGLLLYPRGTVAFPPPVPPLPPWSQSSDGLWAEAAATALGELDGSTARLEGDLDPGANAQALTLVRVDDASTQGAPLLAIRLSAGSTAYGTHG